jgi:hypothetical protein
MYGKGFPEGFTVPEGYSPPPGMPRDWIMPPGVTFPSDYQFACPPGVQPETPPTPPAAARAGAPAPPPCIPRPPTVLGSEAPPPPQMRTVMVMHPSELPDYRPPIPPASVRADEENNLWIRTIPARPVPGGIVYDIVSREGRLVKRIQLPPGYSIVGFGKDKVVYLSTRDREGIHLARVSLR